MSIIDTYRPARSIQHPTATLGRVTDELTTAIDAVAHTAAEIARGRFAATPHALARPLPIAFLDDGRRVFLVVDAGVGRPADQPRSWGVEVTRDGDLVGDAPGDRTAVRTTRRLTARAAADAVRYALQASADQG